MEVDIKENYIIDSGTENEHFTSKGDKLDSNELQVQSLNSNENLKKKPIYILTIELEEGRSESIHIYSDSIPDKLAYEFCSANRLDFNALNYLSKEISKLITQYGTSNFLFLNLINNKKSTKVKRIIKLLKLMKSS